MKLLGVDPGYSTGIAVMEIPEDIIIHPNKPFHKHLLDTRTLEGYIKYKDLLEEINPDVVVIEDYRLYPSVAQAKSWDKLIEVRILGVIEYLTKELNKNYILQPPADKFFYTDKILKQMKLYQKIRHENDAIRHILHYYDNEVK